MPNNAAILLAAGSGKRMDAPIQDKIRASLQGKPIFLYSLEAFIASGTVDTIIVAYRDLQQKESLQALASHFDCNIQFTQGGKERQDSVLNALDTLDNAIDFVFIHDCARPLITPQILQKLHDTVIQSNAAVLAHPATDTIKQVDFNEIPHGQLKNLNRNTLWAMETPQAFRKSLITEAYRQVNAQGIAATDDVAVASHLGHKVTLVHNPLPNIKITHLWDIAIASQLLETVFNTPCPSELASATTSTV